MRRALSALAVVAVLASAGCDAASVPAPGPARIDVDTPQLRQLKREAGVEPCEPGPAHAVEGGLPGVSLPCLGGGPDVDLASLRGPLVVSLWASWCGPCRHELPILARFHEEYGDQVAVVGVDYTDPQTVSALRLVQDSDVTYPLLADPQSALSARAPFPVLKGLPFLALVDADGRVVHQEFGGIRSEDQLVDLVREQLGVEL
jgi:thiol-disulfide isomerase/thioredoxin